MEHLKAISRSFSAEPETIFIFFLIVLGLIIGFLLYIYIPVYVKHMKETRVWNRLMERHRIKEWEKKMMEHVARADRLMPGYWVAIRPWTFEKFRPDMIKYLKEKMNMGAAEASTLLAELSSRLFDV